MAVLTIGDVFAKDLGGKSHFDFETPNLGDPLHQGMFYIHPEERPLVAAAIRLGEWFISNADLIAEDREKVARVVEAIKKLPEVSADVSGGFGFSIADDAVESWDGSGVVPIGSSEHWEVFYGPTADSASNLARGQIWFEVFNSRFTYPQREHDELYDIQSELSFLRTSVDTTEKDYSRFTPDAFNLARMYDWINCADHVQNYKERSRNFKIEVY